MTNIPNDFLTVVEKRAFEYGADKVWLFGSALTDGMERAADIDLAVKGISAGNFYPFYGDLIGDISDKYGKMTDLVDMDNDRGLIIPIIEESGVVIYERQAAI